MFGSDISTQSLTNVSRSSEEMSCRYDDTLALTLFCFTAAFSITFCFICFLGHFFDG